jgi:purine catabolism regulator
MRCALTVADVMDLSVMKGTRIIAGSRGLSRRVSAISVIAGTEMTKWVKSGAIAISTGHPFAHLPVGAAHIIDELADCGVSCLAIRLGPYLTELPDAIVLQANERGVPIIQLSDRHAFDEIIIDVLRELESFRVSNVESVQDAYSTILAGYLKRGSLHDVVTALHDALRGRVVIYNEFGDVILDSHPDSPQLLLDVDPQHFPFGHVVIDHDKQGITIRLGSEQTPIGWIRAVPTHEEFGRTAVSIMEAVVDVVTVAVRQSGVINELIGPYVNEFLADLVADDTARVDRGVERIVASGFVPAEAYEVAVVAVWGAPGAAGQRNGARVRQRIRTAAAHACSTSDLF